MHTIKVPQETQNAIDRIVWEKLREENFYNMLPPSTSNEEIKEEQIETSWSEQEIVPVTVQPQNDYETPP